MPFRKGSVTHLRSAGAGCIDRTWAGKTVRLAGWVHRRRNLGGLAFVDLRDASGYVQVRVGPDDAPQEVARVAKSLASEDVVTVEGTVRLRPAGAGNPEMATGEVEVLATAIRLRNRARTPEIPVFLPQGEPIPSEELRLRHRILDLRRPESQRRLELRHQLLLEARKYFDEQGFLEIETPILTKPTPEGARDFLVPSRVHPGEFFALPQSPQLYKQLLMTAGVDRYFQIARCFRDEDPRADRQPEFTQIDVEASFVREDDVFRWVEGLVKRLARVAEAEAAPPFERMTHAQAMERFGSDAPDLRYALEISDFTEELKGLDHRILRSVVQEGGRLRGFVVPGGADLARSGIARVEARAQGEGAPGLFWAKGRSGSASGPLGRFLDADTIRRIGLSPGGLLLLCAGADAVVSPALAGAREALVEESAITPARDHAWLWVTDFPLFEQAEDGSLTPGHHPFVMPRPEDLELLESEPLAARGSAYDLVYNGVELGSGSIRIHDAALQRRILEMLGLSPGKVESDFGFLLDALGSGAPPHGGIALGADRLAAMLAGAPSLRDVIAFPKTTQARALFEAAPRRVPPDELRELGIALPETEPGESG